MTIASDRPPVAEAFVELVAADVRTFSFAPDPSFAHGSSFVSSLTAANFDDLAVAALSLAPAGLLPERVVPGPTKDGVDAAYMKADS